MEPAREKGLFGFRVFNTIIEKTFLWNQKVLAKNLRGQIRSRISDLLEGMDRSRSCRDREFFRYDHE